MHLKNRKDFIAGLLFMAVGVYFAWSASRYTVGSAANMGPGYFPLLLGAVLTVLGSVVVFKALVFETEDGGRIASLAWRPVLCVLLATLAFGVAMGGLSALGIASLTPVQGALVLIVVLALCGRLLKA